MSRNFTRKMDQFSSLRMNHVSAHGNACTCCNKQAWYVYTGFVWADDGVYPKAGVTNNKEEFVEQYRNGDFGQWKLQRNIWAYPTKRAALRGAKMRENQLKKDMEKAIDQGVIEEYMQDIISTELRV